MMRGALSREGLGVRGVCGLENVKKHPACWTFFLSVVSKSKFRLQRHTWAVTFPHLQFCAYIIKHSSGLTSTSLAESANRSHSGGVPKRKRIPWFAWSRSRGDSYLKRKQSCKARPCACVRARARDGDIEAEMEREVWPASNLRRAVFPVAESNQAAADACSRGIAPLQPSGLIRTHVCSEEGCRSGVTTRHALTCVRTVWGCLCMRVHSATSCQRAMMTREAMKRWCRTTPPTSSGSGSSPPGHPIV